MVKGPQAVTEMKTYVTVLYEPLSMWTFPGLSIKYWNTLTFKWNSPTYSILQTSLSSVNPQPQRKETLKTIMDLRGYSVFGPGGGDFTFSLMQIHTPSPPSDFVKIWQPPLEFKQIWAHHFLLRNHNRTLQFTLMSWCISTNDQSYVFKIKHLHF